MLITYILDRRSLLIKDIIIIVIAIGLLLLLSFALEKRKINAYLIPPIFGIFFGAFTVWLGFWWGSYPSSTLYNSSIKDFFLLGQISFIAGAMIGLLLVLSTKLWINSKKILSILLLFTVSISSVFCTSGIFIFYEGVATG